MKRSRSIPVPVTILFFALLGNCIGSWLYKARRGRQASGLVFKHTDRQDHLYITVPVWFNFLPALLLGRLIEPHWLVSLLAGMASTAVQGDEVQARVMERIAAHI